MSGYKDKYGAAVFSGHTYPPKTPSTLSKSISKLSPVEIQKDLKIDLLTF